MRLFIESGFDNVTTSEIARAAGVSPATLFNYFATKDDLVFGQVAELEQALVDAVRTCPPGQSILDVLQDRVLWDLTAGRAYTDPAAVKPFHRLVMDSPHLMAREAEIYQHREQVLVTALIDALGPTADATLARVVAALFIAAERLVAARLRDRLAAGGSPAQTIRELDPFIDAVFTLIRNGTGAVSASTPADGGPPAADGVSPS